MRLQIVSDLHMEFSPIEISNGGADILVLAGDICVANRFTRGEESPYFATAQEWLKWFERTCAKFDKVIYILGNHEHYYGRFYQTYDVLKTALGHIPNLHILDKSYIDLNGFRFIGGTLWTDFGSGDSRLVNEVIVANLLNDYKCVQGRDYRKLSPKETARYHREFLSYIDDNLTDNTIVVGHHLPSYRSVASKHKDSGPINSGYASHLDHFIRDRTSSIPLWIHGHTHSSMDYTLYATRVFCNPRGYQLGKAPAENRDFDKNKVIIINVR